MKNVAAWALKAESRPLVISNAPYALPPAGHLTIKVYAVAINPIDWMMQDSDLFNLKYPAIFGLDIAGEVAYLGEGVDDFTLGQKVIAHGNGYSANDPSHGAFQKYVTVPAHAVAELPSSISLVQGAVLPLGISTAAAGLYQKHFLALPLPRNETVKPLQRAVLIWGGSSSVGSCAIQLAVASGVEVYTTASASNFDYCRNLGANFVFDYHDDDVEDQIVSALHGKTVAGAYHAVGADGAVQACARIVDRCFGKAIVVTVRGVPDKGLPSSVRVKAISSSSIFAKGHQVGPYIWRKYLPKALITGNIVPKPDPLVVGEGLRSIQHGLDRQKKGVSAAKVVVADIQSDGSSKAITFPASVPMPRIPIF